MHSTRWSPAIVLSLILLSVTAKAEQEPKDRMADAFKLFGEACVDPGLDFLAQAPRHFAKSGLRPVKEGQWATADHSIAAHLGDAPKLKQCAVVVLQFDAGAIRAAPKILKDVLRAKFKNVGSPKRTSRGDLVWPIGDLPDFYVSWRPPDVAANRAPTFSAFIYARARN